MRIVAHNGARIFGGAERATVSLLRGLIDRGHDVTLLCNDSLVADEATKRGVPAEICEIGGDVAVHHALRISRVLKRRKPDAFIVTTYKKLFHASLGARMAKVPRVVVRVGLESDTPRSIKYKIALARWVDVVVVNARRMSSPFRASNVSVIWNSVSDHGMAPRSQAVRKELGLAESDFVVGTVARLARQKRLDRLIEAVQKLPGITCVIAGDGTQRESLEALARALGVEKRVHFLGHREDVRHVLDALDVFVVASDSEGMSNAMLEAMSRGIPVVSTDVSGAEDALAADVANEEAGFIVGFDPGAIAAAISKLEKNEALRGFMGAAGIARAQTRFSRETMLSMWEAVLSR